MSTQHFDLTSQDFKRNPMPTFVKMREASPIVRAKMPMIGEFWMATTYEAVTTLLRDQQSFVM